MTIMEKVMHLFGFGSKRKQENPEREEMRRQLEKAAADQQSASERLQRKLDSLGGLDDLARVLDRQRKAH